jgi:hypothetical protein
VGLRFRLPSCHQPPTLTPTPEALMSKFKLKTTRYNESSINSDSEGYMKLTRYINSYAFEIIDNGGDQAYLEIGPIQAKRLIKNLTDALKINGHIKE